VLPQPGLLRDLAAQKQLVALDDAAADLVDENYSSDWRDLASVDGTLYGVWLKGANKSTVWYDTKTFEDAGVDPPTSWSEFVEGAQTIADSGVAPIAIGGADGWTLTDWFENVYLRTAGADMYDKLAAHEIPWTDPSVTSALQTLGEVFGDPDLVSGGTTTALQSDFPASVTRVFSDPAEAAIVYEGDFVSSVISDETEAVVGEDADYFAFPEIDQAENGVVGGGDVAVLMTDSEGGRALIAFLASPEAGEVWAGLGGFVSPNQNVDPDSYPDEVTRRVADDLTSAEVFRFDMSDLQPAAFGATEGSGMWGILQQFLQEPTQVQRTAQQLEDAADRAYGG
jgi:alpha-glucoside transport system substrate-binding protein